MKTEERSEAAARPELDGRVGKGPQGETRKAMP